MDWKDTVITGEVKQDLIIHWSNTIIEHMLGGQGTLEPDAQEKLDAWIRGIREAQAEISFKAGRDSFLDDVGNATIPLSEAYKAGMQEVVEWVKKQCSNGDIISVSWDELEAELKKWGIKNAD